MRDASTDHWIREAAKVCRAAAQGDMEARILRIDATGDLADMLHAINHLLDMTDSFVREATASLGHASRGKFFRRVLLAGMLGSFRRAARSINGASEQMDRSSKELKEAEARRAALAQEFEKALRVVSDLAQASSHIAAFSADIHKIADQTNMLSLNAAIEAARVGEAGKGFGVVATEVKRLAAHTALATKSIESKLEAIQHATQVTVESLQTIQQTLRS